MLIDTWELRYVRRDTDNKDKFMDHSQDPHEKNKYVTDASRQDNVYHKQQ